MPRSCRAPRNKEGHFRNQDNTRKQGNNEDTLQKAMLLYECWKALTRVTWQKNRKNEVLFSEEVAVLKREVACKDYEINMLKSEFEKVKQEKEGIKFKIEKFDKASKDLDKLLGSQITNKSKKGLGYSAVPPPHPLIYNRPKKLDLSYSGLDEFKQSKSLNSKLMVLKLVNKAYSSDFKEIYGGLCLHLEEEHDGEEISQDFIVMPIWKDASYFDSLSKDVDNGEPKSATDDQKQTKEEGIDYEEVFAPVARIEAIRLFLGKPQHDDKGFVDSGCSRHMTRNIAYLLDFKEFDKGYVAFRGGAYGGRITENYYCQAKVNAVEMTWAPKLQLLTKFLSLEALFEGRLLINTTKSMDERICYIKMVPLTKVGDEAVHKELGDRMERAATTTSSLEAEQDSGSGPRCQDTILGDVDAQTRFEITSKQSNDPPLSRGYTLGSGEDSMKLLELMEFCTQLSYKNRKSVLFLLLVYINAAKLMLMLLGSVNAVRHMLMLPLQVPAAEESDGFAEIIDFLKASSVHYALTVNPIIYTSCIEQFWATAKVQTVNRVRQLQALVDKKRVIITESSIRCNIHFEDAGGTDCLPTTTIFEELARMGYENPSQKLTFYKAFFYPQWKYFFHTITQCLSAKSIAWNEFSSTMASLIICLAINQKFNLLISKR
ncbi:hypothetical protein Tco_1054871 [Tanacetum coccineum]|uniref:Uncharacterized protein n=1 Tax=Tanacetum coccineum TaxID=301880 RepID=A0ABQ5GYE1_9ASTR